MTRLTVNEKEQFKEFLKRRLDNIYCWNCGNEDNNDDMCEECHRKYMNWKPSDNFLNEILEWFEVERGIWIGIDDEPHETWECDRCGMIVEMEKPYDFCPKCGAKMEV